MKKKKDLLKRYYFFPCIFSVLQMGEKKMSFSQKRFSSYFFPYNFLSILFSYVQIKPKKLNVQFVKESEM